MAKYRKKPVVIEAVQFDGETDRSYGAVMTLLGPGAHWTIDLAGVHIKTLEGEMVARPGDWIIKGVAGEFYPCKPDIFAATYEPVTPEPGEAP